ncbi:MAG: hypothetical protein OQK04_01365, partial [Kangiellaceae bacterium]|nr:hypothetical protein [Kangiellaceae bacterium]
KNEKQILLKSLSAMIEGNEFSKINKRNFSADALAARLSSKFKSIVASDVNEHRLFSLIYDQKLGRYKYATDSLTVKQDTILVSSSFFDIPVIKDSKNNIVISHYGVTTPELEIRREEKKFLAKILLEGEHQFLAINNKKVLQFPAGNQLVGTIKNIRLSHKSLNAQTLKLAFDEEPIEIGFRYVPVNHPLHVAGNFFNSDLVIATQLQNAIDNNESDGVFEYQANQLSDVFVYSVILGSKNKKVGVLVLQISPRTLAQIKKSLKEAVFLGLSILAIMLMLAAIFFARKITNPMEQLTVAISRLIQNDFNFKLSARNFGSFGYLANQFNLMLVRLQKSRNEMIRLNKSYSRFVPHQLLKQLSAGGVSEISLGDSCERQMTVLFCDIRGFTSLSETMSPQANFRFINRYLNQIAPVINKHGGIIDKYLGDGIMALFPKGADAAVQAAIEMIDSLGEYNKMLLQKKLPAIEVGLGLHSGRTMLGTVGTTSRMDATVISDTVNAAARIESMTKAFNTQILISEETKQRLNNLSQYRIRYIASCNIQGKNRPITLYEIFDNDNLTVQREKMHNQSMMIQAWKKYKDGDPAMAIQMYQKLIETSPHDKSLFALIERCQSGRL